MKEEVKAKLALARRDWAWAR